MEVRLSISDIVRVWIIVIVVMFAGQIASQVAHFVFKLDSLAGFSTLFSLEEEANLPTWASSLLLFSVALVLALIAAATRAQGGKYVLHWFGLALIFVFLSADEVADIHAIAGRVFAHVAPVEGLQSVWVIPYAVLALIVVALYVRFWLSLPGRTMLLFAVSAVAFVGGAIGLEVVEDRYIVTGGQFDVYFVVLATLEELLEMSSILLFLYACLDYQRRQFAGLRVGIA